MIITIPFPPSTNTLTKAVYYWDKRRHTRRARKVETQLYTRWKHEAGQHIITQRPNGSIHGAVDITIKLCKPDKRRRDVDNHIKAPLDLLVAHGLIDDDRNVQSILAYWHSEAEGCEIEVRRA